MKILITGFDPFDGETLNPAWETVKGLPEELSGARIRTLQIPTAFQRAAERITEAMAEFMPDRVLMVGQAGGRAALSLEFVGINWQDGRIPDNDGFQPSGCLLEEEGETAYFATLPLGEMTLRIREAGIPAVISYSAGTYVCNTVLYRVLRHIAKNDLPCKAGFLHVPYTPEQVVDKAGGTPSMAVETILEGLLAALQGIIDPNPLRETGPLGQTE